MRDCFAYKEGKGCTALKATKCNRCNFYKTMEQVEKEQRKVIERIKSLDIEKREHINETYYDGILGV